MREALEKNYEDILPHAKPNESYIKTSERERLIDDIMENMEVEIGDF